MSWTWSAQNHSGPLFMWALQANIHYFRYLHVLCRIPTLKKSETLDARYSMTLQKRDSMADIFPGVDLGRGYRGLVLPLYFFWNCTQLKHTKTSNINKIYQTELRLKEMTCLMTIAETKKTFSAFQFFH